MNNPSSKLLRHFRVILWMFSLTVQVSFKSRVKYIYLIFNCYSISLILGVYYMWDHKPYTELTADDLLSHFKVNTLVKFVTHSFNS